MLLFLLYLFNFLFISLSSPSRISLFLEVPSLHAAPFNAILWRWSRTSTSSSPSSSPCVSLSKNTLLRRLPHNKGWFLLLLPGRWRRTILICCVRKFFLATILLAFLSYRIGSGMGSCFYSSSFMCKVQNQSPICVLTVDIFATLSTTFKLPSYAPELAHLLPESPSPPLSRTRPFNKLVFNFLDIEADQGKDSDRHGSLSS